MYCVGTLSSKVGWETKSVENAMYWHFYYWFVSRAGQSKIIGDVPSFYDLWKKYGEQQDQMVSNTKTFLGSYMKELFPNAVTEVTTSSVNGAVSLYRLSVSISVEIDKIRYQMAKIIEVRPEAFELLDKHRLG